MAEERAGLPIHPFKSVAAFEKWLERHHETADGLWVKIGKKANPAPSITYDEAVEVGLCFGWIDGLKNTYDELWYVQRFTPRKPRSIWSQTNIVRVERLLAEGRMRPAGWRRWRRPRLTAGGIAPIRVRRRRRFRLTSRRRWQRIPPRVPRSTR